MKKILVLLSAACIALAAQAVTHDRAQQAIGALATDSTLTHASLSVAVMDIGADTLVAAHNPNLSCITASTMKTVTSSTALRLLGPDFRFATRVQLVGQLKGNKFKGNVVVIGDGDPTLGSRYMPQDSDIVVQVVLALQARGIKKVEGQIVTDGSCIPYPPYNGWWDVGDLAWDYGMGIHGLNYADNALQLTFTGHNGHEPVITPPVPGLEVIEHFTDAQPSDELNAYLEYAHPAIVLTGRVASKPYSLTLANPTPEAMLADSLKRAIASAGIKFKCKPKAIFKVKQPATVPLLEHHSQPLTAIITGLLDRSDNMWTEALLRAVARHSGREATASQGTAVVDSLWRASGLDTRSLYQYDGSGLARANKNSALFFVRMLSWMQRSGTNLYQLMPQAGRRIGKLLPTTPLATDIVLKSGSMTQVQCYVGYWPAQAPRYAFAVLVNSWQGSRAALKNNIDRMLISVFRTE